ncbi:Heptaprenyl diphosphate synthase component 2 [bioreactor metagenome]|uniref:Heptaprenyl diphosphate synthase component 2 n=1 Tax=bioreactor metagenome TaxID=1076179 RepID=A0A644YP21_9ZZZZ
MKTWNELPGLERELEQVERCLGELGRDPLGREPLSAIMKTAMEQKGKRIRPVLILLAGRLGPDYPDAGERLCRLATVVELTHAASLIHDDIIDDAPLRRGRPTVQASFGKDMAVYAGDFLLSRILGYLMEHRMIESGTILARSMTEMCCGEITQYEAQFDTETGEERYFTSILGKTAAMFAASCELGALETGCDEAVVSGMRQFGRELGVLYQLRDDLLDFTSSAEQEGKPAGSDFRHGIYTLPVLHAFADPGVGPELKEIARKIPYGDPEGVLYRRMEELVAAAGGVEYTRRVAARYESSACKWLACAPDSSAVEVLERLTHALAAV